MNLFRSVLVLSLVAASSTVSQGQDLLRWKLKRGDALNYMVQQKMESSRNSGGADASSKMDQKMSMSWTVLEVGASEDAVMTQVIDRIQMQVDNPQVGLIEVDTAISAVPDNPLARNMSEIFSKIVGNDFKVTMKPTGKISNVTVPPDLMKVIQNAAGAQAALDEEAIKEMMRRTAVTLPEQPVSPGDTWTTSDRIPMPFGVMELTPQMTYRGREAETSMAVIDFVPSVKLEPIPESEMKVTLTDSEGVGRVKFDLETGRLQSMQMRMKLSLTIEFQGQTVKETVNQSTSLILTP